VLVPDPRRDLKCERCGAVVDARCGGYWILLLQERGRCRFPGAQDLEAVLCSGCGRRLRERLESSGVKPWVPAYSGK
jgi:ribosomal protein S27E